MPKSASIAHNQNFAMVLVTVTGEHVRRRWATDRGTATGKMPNGADEAVREPPMDWRRGAELSAGPKCWDVLWEDDVFPRGPRKSDAVKTLDQPE